MKKSDFFIIGAPKCGTTTLYSWLKEHPDIFMPEGKEPHYFARELSDRYRRVQTEEEYLDLFAGAKEHQKCGEASVLYSFYPDALKEIMRFNPQAKIIFMLRNPIDMAISYHAQLLVNLEEDIKNFEKAWGLQEQRKQGNNIPKTSKDPALLQYKKACALGTKLKNMMSLIPENQYKIVVLDDLAKNPERVYQEVIQFIGVEKDGRSDFFSANEASAISSRFLQHLRVNQSGFMKFVKTVLKKILPEKSIKNFNRIRRKRVVLSPSFKEELQKSFEEEIRFIENALGRSFPRRRKEDL